MKKILITGGAGYIGSKLSTYLLSKNYKVTVLDNQKYTIDSLNHLFSNKNFTFLKFDSFFPQQHLNLIILLLSKNFCFSFVVNFIHYMRVIFKISTYFLRHYFITFYI